MSTICTAVFILVYFSLKGRGGERGGMVEWLD